MAMRIPPRVPPPAINLTAFLHFRRVRTTIHPIRPDRAARLVT
jgi:hypothetical protein